MRPQGIGVNRGDPRHIRSQSCCACLGLTATINLPHLHAELAVTGPGIHVKASGVGIVVPTRYLYHVDVGVGALAGARLIASALDATGLVVNTCANPPVLRRTRHRQHHRHGDPESGREDVAPRGRQETVSLDR
ncbi:hypothetical protein [Nocardia mikamii]|uniref:hypothetical protein n=1 Tax=Nocardia mikamii TaxID=508464 RepID=UPI000B141DBF|nr:hypothetical protein [Nocardia mikamii]